MPDTLTEAVTKPKRTRMRSSVVDTPLSASAAFVRMERLHKESKNILARVKPEDREKFEGYLKMLG